LDAIQATFLASTRRGEMKEFLKRSRKKDTPVKKYTKQPNHKPENELNKGLN
jgi:hypothetical protein